MMQRNLMVGSIVLLGALFAPAVAGWAVPEGMLTVETDAVDEAAGETAGTALGVAGGAAGTALGLVEGAVAAKGAYCAGKPEQPCADTACGPKTSSAHAYGESDAEARARSGPATIDTQHQRPVAHAESAGPGPTEGWAKGYDADNGDAEAHCMDGDSAAMQTSSAAPPAVQVPPESAGVGCLADGAITATESFLGQVFVAADGALVAYDAARGQGIALASLDIHFDGASLRGAAPVDLAGFQATNLVVGLDLVTGTDGVSCSATLFR